MIALVKVVDNPNGTTPSELMGSGGRLPKVARSSQPWALLQNPFGIRPEAAGLFGSRNVVFGDLDLAYVTWLTHLTCRPCIRFLT